MKKLGFAIIGMSISWVYYTYNPAKYSFFPTCPFHTITGLNCPGCGSQRALFCLLHADIQGAVHQNLLLVISLPFLLIHFCYRAAEVISKKKIKWSVIYHPLTPVVAAVLIVAFFVVRNLPFYPFKH